MLFIVINFYLEYVRQFEDDLSECVVENDGKKYKFLCLIMGKSDFDFYDKV